MSVYRVIGLVGIMVLALSALSATAETGAQAPVTQGAPAEAEKGVVNRYLDALTRRLALTSEQQEAIKVILADEAAQLGVLRKAGNLSVDEKMAKRLELRAVTEEKIRPILTPDQQIKHDEQVKKSAERRKNRVGKKDVIPIK